jgi:cytochrome P450
MSDSQVDERGNGQSPDAADEALFTDYDHVARLCLDEDPVPLLRRMRESCPVGRSEAHGGSWVLTRYQDIYDITRDPQTFCSGKGVSFPSHGMPPLPPIESDPPVHGLFRGPLIPRFSPGAMAKNESHAREVVTELIDGFIESGHGDLAQQLTVPLPALVNTPVLGIPFDDREKFQDWAVRLLSSGGQDLEAIMATAAYFSELYQVRKNEPLDDIPTLVTKVEVDGQLIGPDTFVLVMVMLMSAGLDTTTNAGSHILFWLAQHPEQRRDLVEDPSRIPAAVEELLRHITPLPTLFRTATRTATVHSQEIPEGDRVQLSWMAANHDPEEFSDPENVKLDRSPNRHFAFGVGAHRCLGAALARLELKVLLEEALPRLGDYRLAEPPTRYAGVTRGIQNLHVTFAPGNRLGGR